MRLEGLHHASSNWRTVRAHGPSRSASRGHSLRVAVCVHQQRASRCADRLLQSQSNPEQRYLGLTNYLKSCSPNIMRVRFFTRLRIAWPVIPIERAMGMYP